MIDFYHGADERKKKMLKTWKYLHEHAEVSWKEANTTKYLEKRLAELGLRTLTFPDCTGVIGEWGRAGEGDLIVALRSDIDALWQNVDGEWCANHSYGHDAHMTIVLGAIEILKNSGYTPPGKIKVIFQPAEEKGEGALKLVEKGVADDIDYLYGIHLRPIQEFQLGKASPAIYNGASTTIKGEIRGVSSHGARPQLGVNVIEVASHIVQLMQSIHLNPMVPATAKMTRLIAGGDSANIIPDYAEFSIDARAQTNEILDELERRIEHIFLNAGEAFGAEVSSTYKHKTAAAIVDEDAKKILHEVIAEVLGEQNVSEIVTPGAEDFHFYPLMRPSIKATMLGLGCDLQPGLHHPHMQFNHSALHTGADILARAIVRTFEKGTLHNRGQQS